ncbi:molecular chaperone TorD family protein [Hoeflea olei]|uniref:Molecular chaperone TorD n=1 Tax=Hoeflea olei TaxID=1480615 RepID=A0A1C1YSE2_9HYPH|nr:molecular chaperone TorD family protein [Hoeflea olei]OCW56366.1 hypothetical protein AWJ14_19970 [Hoeflea olei]
MMNTSQAISGPQYADAVATLSGLFGTPLELEDLEAMALPAENGPLGLLARIPLLQDDVAKLIAIARDFGSPKAGVIELNKAFCRLFLGAGGPMSAPPYESAYLGSGRLFQAPAGEMAKLLREQCLQPVEGFPEAPDHLVVELSLLEESLRLAGVSEDKADIATVRSLHERLKSWVPAFEKACGDFDRTGFYACAARLLGRLLNEPLPCPSAPIAA